MKVYAGTDPLTGREIRSRKTEQAAQIELGKLLAQAAAGRQPDSAVTVAQLLDQYVSTAGWDVSTRESNLGYIRRTINPALGSMQVRKVGGPLLDTLYARLIGPVLEFYASGGSWSNQDSAATSPAPSARPCRRVPCCRIAPFYGLRSVEWAYGVAARRPRLAAQGFAVG